MHVLEREARVQEAPLHRPVCGHPPCRGTSTRPQRPQVTHSRCLQPAAGQAHCQVPTAYGAHCEQPDYCVKGPLGAWTSAWAGCWTERLPGGGGTLHPAGRSQGKEGTGALTGGGTWWQGGRQGGPGARHHGAAGQGGGAEAGRWSLGGTSAEAGGDRGGGGHTGSLGRRSRLWGLEKPWSYF